MFEGLFLLLIAVEGPSRTRSRAPEKSRVDVGAGRLRAGRRRVDFIPARDTDHSWDNWRARTDLERSSPWGRSRHARFAGRHRVVDQLLSLDGTDTPGSPMVSVCR